MKNNKEKKHREITIWGKNSIDLAIKHEKARSIFLTNLFIEKSTPYYNSIKEKYKRSIEIISESKFKKIIKDTMNENIKIPNNQQIATSVQIDDLFCNIESIVQNDCNNNKYSTLLILDGITSPGNIGAIIRSAAAFGINGIIIQQHNSSKDFVYMYKMSSGCMAITKNALVTNISATIEYLKNCGYWIYGLDANTKLDIFDSEFLNTKKIAIVLGSEDKGIRPLVRKNCDKLIKIPMSRNDIDSINVSNAAAITSCTLYNRFIKKHLT